MFRFRVSENLRFGIGEIINLGEQLVEMGFRMPAVIIDQGVFTLPDIKKGVCGLEKLNLEFDVYKNEAIEPTYDYLEDFRKRLKAKDYDCLVGIGGGSAMDLAKGLAVLLTNEGPALSFRGFPELAHRPLPVIAIPTTAGSGSEATYNAVFTESKEKKRLGINSRLNFPVCAIIDPVLTLSCPREVTISAGSDALVHALESYVNKNYTSISRLYSKEAFRLLFNNLKVVLERPDDLSIRSNLSMGAYLAGVALVNSGSGAAGAFSYPLGANFNVPHGYAGAVFLSAVIKFNLKRSYRDYASLYDLIAREELGLSEEEKNLKFANKIQELMDQLGIPCSLSAFGLKDKDIEFMAEQYSGLKGAISQNAIEITEADAASLMRELA